MSNFIFFAKFSSKPEHDFSSSPTSGRAWCVARRRPNNSFRLGPRREATRDHTRKPLYSFALDWTSSRTSETSRTSLHRRSYQRCRIMDNWCQTPHLFLYPQVCNIPEAARQSGMPNYGQPSWWQTGTRTPFSNVGVDVFGPWTVVTRKTRGGQANFKRWAVLFTCLVTRAVHIELVEEMTSSAFINALRRF